MVNETPTNILKAKLVRRNTVKNTEVMSSTIFEELEEQQNTLVMVLKENAQISNVDDAINETHHRVSVLRQIVASGHLPTSIGQQGQLANHLICQSSRDWQQIEEWFDKVIIALTNAKYPELAVDLARQLIKRGLVIDEATEHFSRNIYGAIMNFTDKSNFFREELAKASLLELLIEYLKASSTKAEAVQDTKKEDFLRYTLAIFHNLAKNSEVKPIFLSLNATSVLYGYLDYPNDYVQCVSLLCIAQVLSDTPENAAWASERGIVETLIDYCHSALMSSDRRCRGIHAEELAEGLCLLAVSKPFKERLLSNSNITTILKDLLTSVFDQSMEKQRGIELSWQLSFTEDGKNKMEQNCLDYLKAIAKSETLEASLKRNASKTVAYIENWDKLNPSKHSAKTADSTPEGAKPQSAPPSKNGVSPANYDKKTSGGGHVFLSYSHNQKELVHRVYERLLTKGISNLWVDFKNMGSNWINDMALGVEKASTVIIFYSAAYKESSNCRAEAEYAFSLKKKIIPVKAQTGYKADGWLGIIVNPVLWIEMSIPINDAAFEKLLAEINGTKTRYASANGFGDHASPAAPTKCCTIS